MPVAAKNVSTKQTRTGGRKNKAGRFRRSTKVQAVDGVGEREQMDGKDVSID